MTNTDPVRQTFSWKRAVVLAAIVLIGFAHGGCKVGRSDSKAPQGVHLVKLYLSAGNPISIQVATSTTLTASGYYSDGSLVTEAVTWSITPPGYATIDAAGLLTGVAAGLTNVTATDIANPTITKSAIVNVTTTPPGPPVITTTTLPNAFMGVGYSFQIARVNGVEPMTWVVSGGALPSGITLNLGTGVLSGVATTLEVASFTVVVTDGFSQPSAPQDLTLTVVPNPGSGS